MRCVAHKTEYKGTTFDSRFEASLAQYFDDQGIHWEYEPVRIPWYPEKRYYKPDFKVVLPSGESFFVEAKGYFDSSMRAKMKQVKCQHPDIDIRFVFMDGNLSICKSADKRTSYNEWAEKHGYTLWDVTLPPKEKKKKKTHAKPKTSRASRAKPSGRIQKTS